MLFVYLLQHFNGGFTVEIIQAARKIKPNIIIIIGGVHINHYGEMIIKKYPIDFAVKGEGELVLPKLLKALESGGNISQINGILFKDADNNLIYTGKSPALNVEELELMPTPNFDSLPNKLYYILPFETSRGCLSNCAFCSIAHRGNWRGVKASVVLEKLSTVLSLYRHKFLTDIVYFVDDCFTVDATRTIEILSGIRDEKLKCSLMLEARIDQLLRDNIIECLSETSLSMIQIGVECGYNLGLKKIGKNITIEQVFDCAARLKRFNLNEKVFLSFIIGLPWESYKEIAKTIHVAAELVKKFGVHANISWWVPMPSRLWQNQSKYKITINDDIFDNPVWFQNSDYFTRIRPQINHHEQRLANQMIKVYDDLSCPLVATYLDQYN